MISGCSILLLLLASLALLCSFASREAEERSPRAPQPSRSPSALAPGRLCLMVAPSPSLAPEALPLLPREASRPPAPLFLSPLMTPPFSLTAPDEHGVNYGLASFSSLEEAEEALSSLLSELETASPSRAFSLSCLASQLEADIAEALS